MMVKHYKFHSENSKKIFFKGIPWAHLKKYPNRGLNKKALKTDCRNQGGYIEK